MFWRKSDLKNEISKRNRGFTLVELTIVIAIIAVLVAVLAPNYVRYVDKSRWSSDIHDCETLLSEVKTAIVDTQQDDDEVVNETFTVKSDGVRGLTSANNELMKRLDAIDPEWRNLKIRHRRPQILPGETEAKMYTTYEIKIDVTSKNTHYATGTWK